MKPANNAPMYAMIYAKLAEIAREHGYAMAVHGSLARDFDLICVPWVEDAGEPQKIVDAITSRFVLRVIDSPEMKLHNRLCYTLSFGGDVFLDLSFMPRASAAVVDALLNHCPDMECSECAKIICPHQDPMHFHHDGCPSCTTKPVQP